MGKAFVKPALLAVVLVLASCASQEQKDVLYFDKAPLMGMVYDNDSQPCAGAQILVDGKKGPITDIRGRFILPDLSRGEHTITITRDGFEELTTQVAFLNKTDVLYLHMMSFDQLLSKAEASLDQRKWAEAGAYLKRAEKLSADDPVLLYLQAILSYRTGKNPEAVGYLNRILDQGDTEPYVYLFLADVYEKGLGEPDKAAASLEAYLSKRSDADIEKRLEALKEKLGK